MMNKRPNSSIYNQFIGGFKFYLLRLQNQPTYNLIIILAIIVILFSIPSTVCAETFVSSDIRQNTTWTLEGSPYIVTGDITVASLDWSYHSNPDSVTLTIEPGVQIRFNPGTGLMVGIDLMIEPMAVRFDFWEWRGGQIPLLNFFGWFVISYLMHLAWYYLDDEPDNPIAAPLYVIQFLFFTAFLLIDWGSRM